MSLKSLLLIVLAKYTHILKRSVRLLLAELLLDSQLLQQKYKIFQLKFYKKKETNAKQLYKILYWLKEDISSQMIKIILTKELVLFLRQNRTKSKGKMDKINKHNLNQSQLIHKRSL